MGKFLTHEQSNPGPQKSKKPSKPAAVSPDYPVSDLDISGLEDELANIAKALHGYVSWVSSGEQSLHLYTPAQEHYHPVRLSLEGEAVDRIADALTRIADAMEHKTGA